MKVIKLTTWNFIPDYKLLLCVASSMLFLNCAVVKPWEREDLADPLMNMNENAIEKGILEHHIEYREGSTGGTGTQAGGCGCG